MRKRSATLLLRSGMALCRLRRAGTVAQHHDNESFRRYNRLRQYPCLPLILFGHLYALKEERRHLFRAGTLSASTHRKVLMMSSH